MLKEKLPAIPSLCADIENTIFEDVKASAVKANLAINASDLASFIDLR